MKATYERLWAQKLAYAFLDGDWSTEGLIRRGDAVLGDRRRSLRRLVRRVLRAYPRPPADRVRELTAWIAADKGLPTVLYERRRGPLTGPWLMFQPAMGNMPWPVPAIPSTGELAHLVDLSVGRLAWLADVRSLECRTDAEKLRNYRYRWVRKADGGLRLIESPKTLLRSIQRLVLATILDRIPPHPTAHGFVRGRSVMTFAREHLGARFVIRFDLTDFFGSISAARVYGLFRTAGYPEPVAHALTGIATNVVPRDVWEAAPAPEQTSSAINAHFMLGKRLAMPHLPQGAPTSPALANLCAHGLDRRLSGLSESMGLRYTRYADDLAFSGSPTRAAIVRLRELVAVIAREEGFAVNERKTVVMGSGRRQRIAGIVVNEKLNVDRHAYDVLRATLHNVTRNGLDAQNRSARPRFDEHLAGRASWASALNPNRKRTLDALLDMTRQGPFG